MISQDKHPAPIHRIFNQQGVFFMASAPQKWYLVVLVYRQRHVVGLSGEKYRELPELRYWKSTL